MAAIGKNFPMRLPAWKPTSPQTQSFTINNLIRGYDAGELIPTPAPVTTLSSESATWQGKLLGGPDRFTWPLIGTPAFEAMAQGLASESDLFTALESAGKVFTKPANIPGKSGFLTRPPRTLLFSHYFGPSPSLLSGILTSLEAANVFFCEGSVCADGLGAGFFGGLPVPMETVSQTTYPGTDPVLEPDNTFTATYQPSHWLGGEVLYFVQALVCGPAEPAYNYAGFDGTTYTLAQNALDADLSSLEEAAKRFSRFKYVVFYGSDAKVTAIDSQYNSMLQTAKSRLQAINGEFIQLADYAGNPDHTIGDAMVKPRLIPLIEDFFNL